MSMSIFIFIGDPIGNLGALVNETQLRNLAVTKADDTFACALRASLPVKVTLRGLVS